MSEEELPTAVWSGDIHGIKVHVLSNGMRVIDQDDVARIFGLLGSGVPEDFDAEAFAADFAEWAKGSLPPTGVDRKEGK